jgi:long-subunit fatty acid transport protein
MKIKIQMICCVFLLGFMLQVAASQEVSKVGTTAANFLTIGVGARAVGMGSAFVAVADDITALYWNPAGVARLEKTQATFSYANWIADITFNHAGFTIPVSNVGTIGVQASFMTMGEMERTTIANPEGTGETFSAGSYAFALCYARSLTDRFSVGINAKYIHEQIYHSAAHGIAFDVGTLFETGLHGLNIGMSITNYGTKMQMSGRDLLLQADIDPLVHGNNENLNANLQTDAFDMPLMFRVGVAMDLLQGGGKNNLLVAIDALHPNNDLEYVNVGGEYNFKKFIFLRAGYKTLFARNSEEGLSFGGGLRFRMPGAQLIDLNYSYQDFGLLKDIQNFTFCFQF